ncbi:hypothetical protein CY34DRAFT_809437 [Suillus luteus UH-Slu-Lm8-n1]|uniref:Unplaced genomic scaffold CY34scaffold_267, whole genome shotgun sequence n=1 Tax=Suillus luteus UH-Slu-Lm8-n1 TaxID=930992 RepID=A0A0C9ZLJ6_9AGAM|nr:hypothetical protein CY34DRAFT_809437 [Suillus luteus UH-Slu-Lm8-n1]
MSLEKADYYYVAVTWLLHQDDIEVRASFIHLWNYSSCRFVNLACNSNDEEMEVST